jgi:molybdopterin molybdotransferase
MRAILGADGVRVLPDQDSSLITVFAAANALVRRLPGATALETGARVEVLRLARG